MAMTSKRSTSIVVSGCRASRRALQDLWDYDRWRGHFDHGGDVVAVLFRQTMGVYLERNPTYDEVRFRAITMDEPRGHLMEIERKRVLVPFRRKEVPCFRGTRFSSHGAVGLAHSSSATTFH